jgi:uncharacterized protein YecE (DUF72 family)
VKSRIFVGTCSFTNSGLVGTFYPADLPAAERISWYAQYFDTVEVDSSFYALPSERNSRLFAQRTPDDFIFNFKAFGLLTKHPVPLKRLGRSLLAYLPSDFKEEYIRQPPVDMLKKAFEMFYQALLPLKLVGKLGVVVFQFPPYFTKNEKNMAYISQCREWLPDLELAIEFRHASWVSQNELKDTLDFLKKQGLSYISVDEPQFPSGTTIPPISEATTKIAYIRFHGRNRQTWFKKGISVSERFQYLYTDEELAEWVPKIKSLEAKTKQIFLMFNNCYGSYHIKNARDLARMLGVLRDKLPLNLSQQTQLDL